MRRRWAVAAGVAVASGSAVADTVVLRGGEAPFEASRIECRPEALVAEVGGIRRTIAWDLVRDVQGRELSPVERRRLELAERLWRGRSRLVRGDAELARPAFEAVAPEFLGGTAPPPSETVLIAAEGLLRVRLAAGEAKSAIVPALEIARQRQAGIRTDRFASLPPAIDEATGLAPALAPAFAIVPAAPGEDLAAADAIAGWVAARPDLGADLRDIARGWEAALRRELPATAVSEAAPVRLVRAAARLASADAGESDAELAAARAELDDAVAAMPGGSAGWVDAWRSFLLGRSLATGRDAARRREGVVLLLSIPARRTRATDQLSRVALAESVRALRGLGDDESADRLERELQSGLPTSPPPTS